MRPNRLDVIEQVVSCTNCGLAEKCAAPVAFSGPNPCSIAILGEAPGAQEDREGKPFIGPAGELLRSHLRSLEIDPNECFIFNTVSCFPSGPPPKDSIAACRPNRIAQMQLADPTWVLVLGKVALGAVRSNLKISVARGRPFRFEDTGPVYFATFHPAAALRNGDYARDMVADLAVFSKMVGDGIEGWKKYLLETCWECNSADVAWYAADYTVWCEKHAPDAYKERMALVRADYEAVR